MNINLKAPFKLFFALIGFMLLGIYATTITKTANSFFRSSNPKVQKLKLPPNFNAEHLYSPSDAGNGFIPPYASTGWFGYQHHQDKSGKTGN
jgi:hypothetical protein